MTGGGRQPRCRFVRGRSRVVAPAAGSPTRCPTGAQRGSVTVEAAVGLAAIVVVLALCLAAISALLTQLRAVDAAREAVRLAARGDTAAATDAVRLLAPAGSVLRVHADDLVTAEVAAPPLGGLLPNVVVRASAVAAAERPDGPP